MKNITSYWDGNAKYQSVFSFLYDKYVPNIGVSENPFGEVVRCLNKLLYDYCNNGNCNMFDKYEYDEYDYESGDYIGKIKLEERCVEYISTIENTIPNVHSELRKLETFILNNDNDSYTQEDLDVYNNLIDKCLEYIISEMNLDLKECDKFLYNKNLQSFKEQLKYHTDNLEKKKNKIVNTTTIISETFNLNDLAEVNKKIEEIKNKVYEIDTIKKSMGHSEKMIVILNDKISELKETV